MADERKRLTDSSGMSESYMYALRSVCSISWIRRHAGTHVCCKCCKRGTWRPELFVIQRISVLHRKKNWGTENRTISIQSSARVLWITYYFQIIATAGRGFIGTSRQHPSAHVIPPSVSPKMVCMCVCVWYSRRPFLQHAGCKPSWTLVSPSL